MEAEGLQYTLIARGSEILVESGKENAGGFEGPARRIPAQLCHMPPGTRKTYTHEGKVFHCVVNSPNASDQEAGNYSPIVIIVLAAKEFSQARAFMFLTDISRMFKEFQPLTSVQTFKLDYSDFEFRVRERMHFYSTDSSIEKVRAVQKQVDETKKVMLENIDLSINRGEKIESIAGKIDDMNASSYSFRKQAKKTKRAFCCQNFRLWWCILATVLLVCLALAAVGLYFLIKWAPWKHKHDSSSLSSSSSWSSLNGY